MILGRDISWAAIKNKTGEGSKTLDGAAKPMNLYRDLVDDVTPTDADMEGWVSDAEDVVDNVEEDIIVEEQETSDDEE